MTTYRKMRDQIVHEYPNFSAADHDMLQNRGFTYEGQDGKLNHIYKKEIASFRSIRSIFMRLSIKVDGTYIVERVLPTF